MWHLIFTFVFLYSSTASAFDPLQGVGDAAFKEQTEEEKEIEAAEKAAAAEKSKKAARVIVLKWKGTKADENSGSLQRNVMGAIGKTNVSFFPAHELFQGGRKIKNRTLPPSQQPAKVPDSAIDMINTLVSKTERITFDSLDSNQWGAKAAELREAVEQIWFVDRVELREPLFKLYGQIGRAVNNVSEFEMGPPFYEFIGGRRVNYYLYLAATMAYQEPTLLDKITDEEIKSYIKSYVKKLEQGSFPTMKLDFQMNYDFDKAKFDESYSVLLNGLPATINESGQKDTFLGRTDILMTREGGVGLSDRYVAVKTDDKAYSVVEDAQKRMTSNFVRQLFLFENECYPKVDEEFLTYLAIYAKMHPESNGQIYVAVPKAGNPNRVWVWRFDSSKTMLSLVEKGDQEFPVLFSALAGTGIYYNGAAVSISSPTDLLLDVTEGSGPESLYTVDAIKGPVPLFLELRAHYTNFMINWGVEYNYKTSGEWTEYIQLDNVPCYEDGSCPDHGSNAAANGLYQQTTFARSLFIGAGYLFGANAAEGMGPRVALRYTDVSIPHGVMITSHFGWAFEMPMVGKIGGKRNRLLIDADIRLGTHLSQAYSMYFDSLDNLPADEQTIFTDNGVTGVFGITMAAGVTF